jgi:trypsin
MGANSDITLHDGRTNVKIAKVTDFIHHEKYTEQFDYDFCLMVTDKDVVDETHSAICLYKQGESLPAIATKLFIAGRGGTNSEIEAGFREGKVELMTYKYCNSQDAYTGFVKPESMFCAGYPTGEIDSCTGDSGGPIVQIEKRTSDGQMVARLIGLVSWGRSDACAVAGFPGVYAKLAAVNDWIHEKAVQFSVLNQVRFIIL